VLLICTALAIGLANSPYAESHFHFWHTEIKLAFGDFEAAISLEHLVNDGLMTIFFFVVGLEIKREIVFGELRDPRKAALPILGAIGGMVAPAAIYIAQQAGQPGGRGWGIPMATDIAFVVGVLALLGPRVPFGLKILLLSLAIADDLGAVLVIALVYSGSIDPQSLAIALGSFAVILVLNQIGVRNLFVYLLIAVAIWCAVRKANVHPTVAGALLGLLTPARPWIRPEILLQVVAESLDRLRESPEHPEKVAEPLMLSAHESVSPLHRLEQTWHPWVAFGIMPIFALANAGVVLEISAIRHPVALAVALGLFVGKPLGIVGASWLGVKLGIARLPAGVNWRIMLAGGCLGGIGFTMSLFVTGLAFKEPSLIDAGKIGTILGSTCSALAGCALAYFVLPRTRDII
jgi:NhaA family Na+:H+ antiporter